MLLIVFLTLCLVPVHIIQKTLQTLWYTFLTFHYNFPRLIRCDHEFGPPNCLATDYFAGDFWSDCRVRLIFLKCCHENLSFPQPVGWIKTKAYNTTSFPTQENIFLVVTENRFIVWNYCFSGPTDIYSFKFCWLWACKWHMKYFVALI